MLALVGGARAESDFALAPPLKVAVEANAFGLGVADINGDKKADLIVGNGNVGGTIGAYLGKGDGTFAAMVSSPHAGEFSVEFMALGDVSGDGKPDIVGCGNEPPSICLGRTEARFGPPVDAKFLMNYSDTGCRPVLADFNGDKKLDLAVKGWKGFGVGLNPGSGAFTGAVDYEAQGVECIAAGDINGDGKQDMVGGRFHMGKKSIQVFYGKAGGTFSTAKAKTVAVSKDKWSDRPVCFIGLGDVNGDGKLDAAYLQEGVLDVFSNAALVEEGDGMFDGKAYDVGPAGALVIADLDRDGRSDVAVAGAGALKVLLGKADGVLEEPMTLAAPRSFVGLVAGDFLGDGRLGLAMVDFTGPERSVALYLPLGDAPKR